MNYQDYTEILKDNYWRFTSLGILLGFILGIGLDELIRLLIKLLT